VPTFADRGVSHGQCGGSPTAVISVFYTITQLELFSLYFFISGHPLAFISTCVENRNSKLECILHYVNQILRSVMSISIVPLGINFLLLLKCQKNIFLVKENVMNK
jgi:hypothetical protein